MTRRTIEQLDKEARNEEAQVLHHRYEMDCLQKQLELEANLASQAVNTANMIAEQAYEAARLAEKAAQDARACLEKTKEEQHKLHASFKMAISEAEKAAVEAEARMSMVIQEREKQVMELEMAQSKNDVFLNVNEAALLTNLHMQARMAKDVAFGPPNGHGTVS